MKETTSDSFLETSILESVEKWDKVRSHLLSNKPTSFQSNALLKIEKKQPAKPSKTEKVQKQPQKRCKNENEQASTLPFNSTSIHNEEQSVDQSIIGQTTTLIDLSELTDPNYINDSLRVQLKVNNYSITNKMLDNLLDPSGWLDEIVILYLFILIKNMC